MSENENHIIFSLRRRWQSIGITSQAIMALAISILLVTVMHAWRSLSFWWLLLIWPVCIAGLLLLYKKWRVSNKDVVGHLNSFYPQFEASTNLLLKPAEERN